MIYKFANLSMCLLLFSENNCIISEKSGGVAQRQSLNTCVSTLEFRKHNVKEKEHLTMKRRIGILLGLALVLICAFAFADVEINETNFPDANFRQYIQNAGFDTDGDGTLSDEELAQVTEISCSEMSISSLAGIEYFTDLTELWCEDNQLTSLDVSRNTSLKVLWCGNNQLATLDVSKNMSLDQLACSFNRLMNALGSGKRSGLNFHSQSQSVRNQPVSR